MAMGGLFYEQFSVGMRFEHVLRRTVTETDNLLFSALTHNPAALHLDEEYMKGSEFGSRIVNSCFTLSLMVGVSVADTTLGTTVANLGWDEVRFPKPVYLGDTLRTETIVHEMRAEQVAAGRRDRHLRAPLFQPAQRRSGCVQTHGAHEEKSGGCLMRSMLFVPGDRPERFDKAVASGADAVIFDLEDAVTPEARPKARHDIAHYIRSAPRNLPLWVRINPVANADALEDVAAIVSARPDGVVLPKARNGDDLRRLDHWLEALEVTHLHEPGSIKVVALVTESAGALLNAASFAQTPAQGHWLHVGGGRPRGRHRRLGQPQRIR